MKISSVSNLLARSFLVFIIAWLWTSFYVKEFFIILLISTAITIVVNYAISFIGTKRNKYKAVSKQQREHMHQVILQLKFKTRAQTLALLKKALPPEAKVLVTQKRFTLCPLFHVPSPTEHDIIGCIKSAPENSKIIITAEHFSPQVIAFARSLQTNIILLDAEATYTKILAPTQTFPEITVQTKKPTARKTLLEIKRMVFGRHRTKSYVITGAIILASSLIIRLHLYYIITATVVFALALTSHFSPAMPKNLFE